MHRRNRFRNEFWSVVCLLLPLGAVAAAGTTIESLLEELKVSGVEVIYSSELLTPGLMAPAALGAGTPLQRASAALAANGLALQPIDAHHYAVVRKVAPARPAAPPADAPLEEVSVYASRFSISARYLSEPQHLSSADVLTAPGSNDDALRALRTLPGLATNASARPYIRGSLTEDVLFRYDGVTLLDPFHLKDFQSLISAIDPAAIDHMQVFSGGFPVQFGTRAGGVVDVSAPELASGYENRVTLSLISGGVSSIGKSERLPLDWFVALRRSTLDLLEPIENDIGKPTFSDSLGRLRWNTGNGAWTAGWLLLDDLLELGTARDEERAHARYHDEYGWIANDLNLSDSLRTRFTAVATSAERERSGTVLRPGIVDGSLNELQEFDRFEFTDSWSYEPDPSSTFTAGAEYARSRSDYHYSRRAQFTPEVAAAFGRAPADALDVVVRPEVDTYALYVSQRHKWQAFEAELGARLDGQEYNLGGSHSQFSPRLNLRYDLRDDLRLYASVGRFTQARHVEDWQVERAQASADPAQTSVHTVLGLGGETAGAMRWTVEAYTKRWKHAAPYFDNLLDPLTLLPDLAADRVLLTPREAEASGIEFNLRRPLSDELSIWSSLSWARVADGFGGGDVPRSWDQPFAMNSGLSWQDSRASVSLLAGWHRGWPRTPLELTPSTDVSPGIIDIGGRNSQRWQNFYTLDLRGSWTWALARGDLVLTLDATNTTNRDNPCCSTLENAAQPGDPRAEVDTWLPAVVNLGLAFRWRGGR